ncbi:MAG: LPS export ABC transporter periplasmic protein LptC [Alphaproteobacteria bacterium]|nr:LPS export ABC transporter periplasmic protein LptC [Alphaproteobacteria bacterium]MBU0794159.1 LPS export ABC transporter periplasmic protein LptC [Alphaproteobacteria bacterium]MBU0876698.1 LPS export ABC transporter periplasmic protein LptC [Alphaproteobacteria bacterium]MBU1769400.1 LPS export ABC transporter periplasmic protein LptC [Alphaproteobacteria bacterium]
MSEARTLRGQARPDYGLAPSAQARAEHGKLQRWAAPGGSHDRLVTSLKRVLPVLAGVLGAFLLAAPFTHQTEVSFVLDKNKVDVASERLKVTEALYRGEDGEGRPFSLRAGSAVQKSSRDPVVQLSELEARLQMEGGGAVVTARQGNYNMENETVAIDGPIQFQSANGYRLTTRDVDIRLNERDLRSRGSVEGRMPAGTFRADHLSADLEGRTVTLEGNARLRMEQLGR